MKSLTQPKTAAIAFICVLSCVFLSGCFWDISSNPPKTNIGKEGSLGATRFFSTIEIDSCEYIIFQDGGICSIAHKGNCRYCAARAEKNE